MAENGQSTNSGGALGEDEILVLPPQGSASVNASAMGVVRLTTRVDVTTSEIPDPPPEKD